MKFFLILNFFLGTSSIDVNYKTFLLEGLYTWYQDRASQAVEVEHQGNEGGSDWPREGAGVADQERAAPTLQKNNQEPRRDTSADKRAA